MSATGTVIGVVVLVVALIVGPFATLRAVSRYRDRRKPPPAATKRDDEDDPDRPSGFW
ncbi:hypothetical protein [Solimonas variicoloris]|uniref:hypothetical protein n=1 Tax=Solimonas variicoloris TaxID=254408 RepID=UPI00037B0FFA|nr:hypothetical protein [Solimonas variicoloris]